MARTARELKLAGVFADAITPHRAEIADPDYSGSLDLLDFLASAGVQAITLFTAAGEFLDYTFQERQRLVYLAARRSRVPIIAGVSHSTLAGAIQLADEAIASGADGLLLMPPYFFRYSQPEIEEFYLRFARETTDAVPVLLHNIPQFTSKLEIETVRRIIDTGRFAGIEDSGGDWPYFENLMALKRERPFALFAGSERIAARALRAGADGVISACPVPELLTALAKSIAAHDEAQATALNEKLIELLDWMEKFPAPVAIQCAVQLRGQKAGAPLTPLAPETIRLLEEFSAWFKKSYA